MNACTNNYSFKKIYSDVITLYEINPFTRVNKIDQFVTKLYY